MTYLALDESVQDGQPIELYRFSNNEEVFTLTSGQDEVVYQTETYVPTPMQRANTKLTSIEAPSTLEITMPATEDFVRRYIATVPASLDRVVVSRFHSTDGGTPEVIVLLSGTVSSVTFKGDLAAITVDRGTAILDQTIPKQSSRGNCNHIHYDARCKVSVGGFSVTGEVSAILDGGFTIDVNFGVSEVAATGLQFSAQMTSDDTYFNIGHLERGSFEFRMMQSIVDQGSNVARLGLLIPFQTAPIGTVIRMAAGCDHTVDHCNLKFSNIINYGGFPFVPPTNPFEDGVL
jgi:hypothetical protein